MRIKFNLDDSIYACELMIRDEKGERKIKLHIYDPEGNGENFAEVDVCGETLEIITVPQMEDYKAEINKLETHGLGEKIAKKFASAALAAVEKDVLRVGCRYRVQNLKDGDEVTVRLQSYAFGSAAGELIFDFLPVMYMFFEVYTAEGRMEPLDAYAVNRKEVLKTNKVLALLNFGIHLIVTYPIQMTRVRVLTRKGKIRRTLRRFHFMSEEKRQKKLARFEKQTDW